MAFRRVLIAAAVALLIVGVVGASWRRAWRLPPTEQACRQAKEDAEKLARRFGRDGPTPAEFERMMEQICEADGVSP